MLPLNRASRLALGATVVILVGPAVEADAGERNSCLTVRLLNWSSAHSDEIRHGVRIADAVFEEAGIDVRWLDCTPDVYGFAPQRDCQFRAGPTELQLSLGAQAPKRLAFAALAVGTRPQRGTSEVPPSCLAVASRRRSGLLRVSLHPHV